MILFDGRANDPILRVAAGGGVAVPAVTADTSASETTVAWPEFLPDGKHFLYMVSGKQNSLMLGKLDSKEKRELFPCDSRVQYAAPGYLLFSRGGTLVAQPFDARSGKVRGDPVPLAEQVLTNVVGGADFSASATGVLAYSRQAGQQGRMVKLDRGGREISSMSVAGDMLIPALSPDEKKLALRIRDAQTRTRDIWVIDLARSVASRLTFGAQNENHPVWSPDGSRVLYYSDAPGAGGLCVQNASGAGQIERVLESASETIPTSWSRDGRFVLYQAIAPQTKTDVWILPMSGERKARPLLNGPYDEGAARVSPDGRWIAYTSNESGRDEVYVQTFPDPGGKWQVSTRGGSDPVWRGDGRELYYLSADQQILSMPVSAAATFEVSLPQPLFPIRVMFPNGITRHYDVNADGSTFYAIGPLEGEAVGTTTVVVNWPADLGRK